MNLLYMKYAVEVAACGSINRAAEKLYIGQPNLSRAIKDLESSLGITIFKRSTKGMLLTPDGELFLKYAKSILEQVDTVENLFKSNGSKKKHFSVSVPRADYISEAFARFSKQLVLENQIDVYYDETNSTRAIDNILHEDYKLAVIRYDEMYDKYFKKLLEEKGLSGELICEFRHQLVVSVDSPLAELSSVSGADLEDYIEIAYPDQFIPISEPKKQPDKKEHRHIYVFERGSQYELLSGNPDTYMWISPAPQKLLARYGLVRLSTNANPRIYKDVLVCRRDYKHSELDNAFISELINVKREIFKS